MVTGSLKWDAISKLATLAADPRLQAAACDVLHVGNDDHWSAHLMCGWSGEGAHQS